MPYHTIPYHTIPYHTMPCHAMPCHPIPYHTIPCHATPRHATPRHAMPCHAMPYHTIPYRTIPYCTVPCHAMQDHKGLVVYYLWGGGGGSFAALSRHFKANPPKPFEVFQLDPPQQNNSGQKWPPPLPFLRSYRVDESGPELRFAKVHASRILAIASAHLAQPSLPFLCAPFQTINRHKVHRRLDRVMGTLDERTSIRCLGGLGGMLPRGEFWNLNLLNGWKCIRNCSIH